MMGKWRDEIGYTIKVDKDVSEILREKGVDLKGIEAVISRFVGCFDFVASQQI